MTPCTKGVQRALHALHRAVRATEKPTEKPTKEIWCPRCHVRGPDDSVRGPHDRSCAGDWVCFDGRWYHECPDTIGERCAGRVLLVWPSRRPAQISAFPKDCELYLRLGGALGEFAVRAGFPYTDEEWWTFTHTADDPTCLRAMLLALAAKLPRVADVALEEVG